MGTDTVKVDLEEGKAAADLVDRIAALRDGLHEQLLNIKNKLAYGEITRDEFDALQMAASDNLNRAEAMLLEARAADSAQQRIVEEARAIADQQGVSFSEGLLRVNRKRPGAF